MISTGVSQPRMQQAHEIQGCSSQQLSGRRDPVGPLRARRRRNSDRPVSETRPTHRVSPTTAPGENPYTEVRSVVSLDATQAKPGSTDPVAKIGANGSL